jgi:phosphotriesterase-related protein
MSRASRAVLKGKVQTVTGLIDPADVGPTLMHEHLFIDLNPPRFAAAAVESIEDDEITLCNCFKVRYGQQPSRLNYRLNERTIAIAEVAEMRAAGGRTIVELTSGGLGPDPGGLVEVARATGVNIVMGCGHYVHEYHDPANADRSVDDFAHEMITQVLQGAWGSDVRAGIIGEIGCQAPWTEQERRVMRGALIAQAETGAALNVHPGRHPDQPQEIADFVVAAGASTERLILSHIDRTIFDADRLLRLADSGCVIEFDLFGWEQSAYPMSDIDMPNDAGRLKMIRLLIDRGHLDRIVISQDICTRTRLTRYGGHGYQHIFANVIPLMRRRGFSADEVDAITVRNPRRLLTFI